MGHKCVITKNSIYTHLIYIYIYVLYIYIYHPEVDRILDVQKNIPNFVMMPSNIHILSTSELSYT